MSSAATDAGSRVNVETRSAADQPAMNAPIITLRDVTISYGTFDAVVGVTCDIPEHQITAMIGPSGCGKSTVLRSINRMNDLVQGAHVKGRIEYHGVDINSPSVDPVEVRKRIGMVFQKPNPFPKSISENITWGAQINGFKGNKKELVESTLRRAALWDEVKDKLDQSGLSLSGGQQQRLCIARTLAVNPDVILMDEPCSALDPISTLRIEELMRELSRQYTIVVVTHNMQQAARVSDQTIFFSLSDTRHGVLVEASPTQQLFTKPKDQRTEDYITGRFG